MKYLLILFTMLTCTSIYAQEGVSVKGNQLSVREIPPVWPGCEEEADKKTCFRKMLALHLKEHYKFPRDEQGNLVRGKAVVVFNIDQEGKPEILSIEGPHPEINREAKRIVLSLPQMIPGSRGGKPIAVKYTVPFTF